MLDVNGDGGLDKEEFRAQYTETGREMPDLAFEIADYDQNGFITWQEFSGPKGGGGADYHFAFLDLNGDGKLDLEEVTAYYARIDLEVPGDYWEINDRDNDGFISLEEYGLLGKELHSTIIKCDKMSNSMITGK